MIRTQTEEARIAIGNNITIFSNSSISHSDDFFSDLYYKLTTDRDFQVWIYCGIIVILFVVSLIRTVGFFNICMNSSINLHKKLFAGVIVAPMRFFELNPVGKLIPFIISFLHFFFKFYETKVINCYHFVSQVEFWTDLPKI